jgi:uncharacterized integral membrane protein
MKKKVKLVVAIIAGVIILAFILQNVQPVELRLLTWKAPVSYALVLIITLIVGFLIGMVTASLLTGREISITMKPTAPPA